LRHAGALSQLALPFADRAAALFRDRAGGLESPITAGPLS
jgi:hypothetical protein